MLLPLRNQHGRPFFVLLRDTLKGSLCDKQSLFKSVRILTGDNYSLCLFATQMTVSVVAVFSACQAARSMRLMCVLHLNALPGGIIF